MFYHFFPWEGNFDIDAGDGDGEGGVHLGPKITKKSQNISNISLPQNKNIKTQLCFIFVPLEGNFYIGARDGGGRNPPPNSQDPQQTNKNNFRNRFWEI